MLLVASHDFGNWTVNSLCCTWLARSRIETNDLCTQNQWTFGFGVVTVLFQQLYRLTLDKLVKMVLCHVVALKFKADLTDEQIIEHFKTEVRSRLSGATHNTCAPQVNLKERMPDLVIEWNYGKNVSLLTRPDVNKVHHRSPLQYC